MLKISSSQFAIFLWRYLPAAAWMGVRVEFLDDQVCTSRLRYSWFNRNPFGSIYFVAQSAAAEMATGLPAYLMIRKRKAKVAMLVTDMEMSFHKQARGTVYFRCDQLPTIFSAIRKAELTDDPVSCKLEVQGLDAATGDLVSTFTVIWRFRRQKGK
ncbi:MAG: DUF4442 domain-containing protein [Saprospiraceae bacterium]|nr:DUF4442 domain-containing protein [Saprospiraceae bacterium]